MEEQMLEYEKGSELFNRWHDAKAKEKKKLPLFIFMAGNIAPSKRGNVEGCWRKAAAITLNGLVMADFDGMDDPVLFAGNLTEDFYQSHGILLVHVTPSHHGLRFVFKADAARGNIADNQAWLAGELSLPLDGVCKDSSRGSFAFHKSMLVYLNDEIFDYEDKSFDEKFGDAYRLGDSSARVHNNRSGSAAHHEGGGAADGQSADEASELPAKTVQVECPTNEQGDLLYKGVPYKVIIAELEDACGGKPEVGERNSYYYEMARQDIRYICDFNRDLMLRVMPDYGLPEQERRSAIDSALGTKRWRVSNRLLRILRNHGLLRQQFRADDGTEDGAQFDHEKWFKTFKPYFTGPWLPVVRCLDDNVKLAGMLAAGAMFGTYLSPVKLLNFYDGEDYRLSFMVYIIGQAASGKGVFVAMNKLIMEPLRILDEQGRKWEERYEEDKAMRSTSTKNQKEAAMQIQHFPIRVLPGTLSNAKRYKRMKDAVTMINGEEVHLHCYIFESELSSKLRSEQGTWAGAQDLDCKSFSNESAGNDYGNAQATNGLIEVNLNQVITGTHDAMNRKITSRNCLDGLATRLILFEMPDSSFKMIPKNRQRRTPDEQHFLRTLGTDLLKCQAAVDLEKKVSVPKAWQHVFGKRTSISDALYQWGWDEADRCLDNHDLCADYFRRRAPIIAARYAVVDAILRDREHFANTGNLTIKFQSVLLAYHLATYIQETQMHFFGGMINDAMESSESKVKPSVKRKSKNNTLFDGLPKKFTIEQLASNFPNIDAARVCLSRWKTKGLVKKSKVEGQVIYVKQ